MKKRWLAAFMSAVMAFAMLPTAGLPAYAAEGDTEYVSLPITIRDYAADGMLFQWNELGPTGDQVVGGATYHHGSTKGYGLLQTDYKDHFNDLADSAAISGTTLTQNGTWGKEEVITTTSQLNSGAKQTLYGCYVRTDLVEPQLDDNKKPVYTEATVTYLASYMQKTLPETWQNSDGSYNMWYVMGTKLFDNSNNYVGPVSSATKDMASVLRSTITGLGSYADTKSKTLSKVTDCTTYFDAAYFLLHNTFTDREGYGQTVKEYSNINLVKKTVDGKSYYVYNSAYDDTNYDTVNGVISNTQTEKITTREGTTYVRGNLQPESRFDPIAAIDDGNAYYGKNGDRYADAVNDTGNDKYYNATNYNLTLEGHAQFIYYADDDLYFNFTGDDDVYLYINGTRVLDLGGAHAISKCGISLNAVQQLCGLKDGEVYDFDFYYMERHGTAANFGIETNIKIVDPSMLTEKNAYQDEQAVGYNGFVNPNKPVTYSFKLTNNGDAQIQNLTFKDDDIGVNLTKDTITLNDDTKINDLAVQVLNENGSTKESYAAGNLTKEKLKQLLTNGLSVGESILIYGFNYTIPETKWSDNKFPNTVYTTAISTGENASHKNLNGIASCQVQKQEFQFEPMHYYEWMGRGVTATKAELIRPVLDADQHSGITPENATITLCSASGQISDAGINSNAQVTSDGIKYTGTATGADTYYYKVGNYGPIAVTVYSYDVADNTYVLDYSLPVELNGEDFGLRVNDTVELVENPYTTTDSTIGITDPTSNYGDFEWSTPSLKYTMRDFMNNTDEVTVTVQVMEEGASGVTTKTGVIMTEKVTVAPANVVYYEDDFPGITYVTEGENEWAYYKSEGSEGNEQSADQDMPYGQDPNYQEDKETTYTKFQLNSNDLNTYQEQQINELNGYLGLGGGDASNGTIHELVVQQTAEVMNFEFRGTGFEIVSRTTDECYAVVSVRVDRKNSDDTYTRVKEFPVITESKGGDLYQVPIISVTGLDRAEYKVTLTAAGSTASKTRVLYIDGIRIYEPLDDVDELKYYNPDEANAEFLEVKSMIKNGKAIYADISDTGNETQLVTGTTLIEDTEDRGYVLTSIEGDVDTYMSVGPNNELYLEGTQTNAVIAFFLKPVDGVAENARTLEIGAHRKADSAGDDNSSVNLVYGSTADAVTEGTNKYTVNSGTEQYYEIDVNQLVKDEANNRYLVMIGTNGGGGFTSLALTNLKVSGYELSLAEQEAVNAVNADDVDSNAALKEIRVMQSRVKAAAQTSEAEKPAVNENLEIKSAALRAEKVVSGKSATLAVKADEAAKKLVVLDADGNEVEFQKVTSKVADGIVTYQAMWTVTGNRGDVIPYTVVVYDENGLASVNTKEISVTIK